MKNKALIVFLILFTFIALATVASAGTETQLTKVASDVASNSYPAWSPSGEELLFIRDSGNYEYILYKVMSDGSSEKKLSDNSFYYTWSPDGSKISYCQNTKDENGISGYALWKMNADGTNKNQLLDPAIGDWHYYYSWFPSGSKILYELGQFPNDHGWFWEIDSDGSNNYEIGGDAWANGEFAVSPDNSKIAYVTYDPDPFNYPPEIRIHNLNQNNYYALTNGIIVQQTQSWQSETWSPDGSKIVYTSFANEHSDIYTINVDGTGKTQLTSDSANDANAIFSPDGSKILYVSDKTGNDDIWVMDADGKNKVQLTTDTAKDSSPVWSPDSKKIAFYSERGGDHAIYVLDLSEEVITVGQGASTPEITQKFIEACDRNGGLSVIGNPTTKVHSVFGFEVQDFPELPATSGGVIMYNPNNKTAYFIHGAIWDKYYAFVDKAKLGPIASDEQIAAILPRTASGYLPLTTNGNYTKFETGTIHWISDKNNENLGHSQRGKSFVTYGALDEIYTKQGGTYSELGFPIMDQETKVEGYDYCEFDGGNISYYDSSNYKIQYNHYISYSGFCFVQITDTHVGEITEEDIIKRAAAPIFAPPDLKANANLKNVITEINNMNPKPEFILVTGDLVWYDDESVDDPGHTGNLEKFKNLMATSKINAKYVPGNHDRRLDPTGTLIEQFLTGYNRIISTPTNQPYRVEFDKNGYKFIGLDSEGDYNTTVGADAKIVYKNYYGFLYPDIDQKYFDSTPESWGLSKAQIDYLNKLPDTQPKVIFMHHPAIQKTGDNDAPVANSIDEEVKPNNYGGNDGCIRWQRAEFIDYCKDPNNNVQQIVTGHSHEDEILSASGENRDQDSNEYPIFIQTDASVNDNGHYRIFNIKDGKITSEAKAATFHPHIVVEANCPVNLCVYDSQNRYTGLNSSGEVEIGIPNSFHDGRSNDTEPLRISLYDANNEYWIEVVANLTEEQKNSPEIEIFNLTVSQYFNESTNTTVTYRNVPLIESTIATLPSNLTTISYLMEIDSNGDGVKDEKREPDSIIINGVETIVDNVSPSSITNLQSTNSTTWINWTWTNPINTDFNHTEIYLNGSFKTNTSAEYFNATNLQPETSYTISTRTVDNYGNVNETWVNLTATTGKKVLTIPIFPGCTKPPLDPNNDRLHEDINGNGRLDFADVVTYYNNMAWISQNDLVAYFDYNKNGRIDFNDVVRLYNLH